MSWMEKAAENFQKSKKEQEEYQTQIEEVKEQFPMLVNQLWEMFEITFKEIAEKFGEKTGFDANGDKMTLVIGDVLIRGTANNTEKMGGYFGSVEFKHESSIGKRLSSLPIQNVFIKVIDDKPRWVYRTVKNVKNVDEPLLQKDIEDLFKSALAQYLG